MNTQDAYNDWANTYDAVFNKTRDLEARAIRTILGKAFYKKILELGCGTGKNTLWLADKCEHLIAADFSEEMQRLAKMKITLPHVEFLQADITRKWTFRKVDLITCSLVLEHISDISFIFQQAADTIDAGGQFYICELHPYKQLQGSKAKYEKDGSLFELEYFIHHISDYFQVSKEYGFICDDLNEWFDDDDRSQPPRLISFLFKKI